MLKKLKFIFFLLICLLSNFSFSADVEGCIRDMNNILKGNGFEVNRNISHYNNLLPYIELNGRFVSFQGFLESLSSNDTIAEMGAGSSRALIDGYVNRVDITDKASVLAFAYERPAEAAAKIAATQKASNGRFRYIDGKLLEDYKQEELENIGFKDLAGVVDINGPGLYTRDLSTLLNTYGRMSRMNSYIFVSFVELTMGMNMHVREVSLLQDKLGNSIPWSHWFSSIKGLKLVAGDTRDYGRDQQYSVVLQKISDTIVAPKLRWEPNNDLSSTPRRTFFWDTYQPPTIK